MYQKLISFLGFNSKQGMRMIIANRNQADFALEKAKWTVTVLTPGRETVSISNTASFTTQVLVYLLRKMFCESVSSRWELTCAVSTLMQGYSSEKNEQEVKEKHLAITCRFLFELVFFSCFLFVCFFWALSPKLVVWHYWQLFQGFYDRVMLEECPLEYAC